MADTSPNIVGGGGDVFNLYAKGVSVSCVRLTQALSYGNFSEHGSLDGRISKEPQVVPFEEF